MIDCPHKTAARLNGGRCPVCVPKMIARLEQLQEDLEIEADRRYLKRCRDSFPFFFKESWHVLEPETPLSWNWHHDFVCDHLQDVFHQWDWAGEALLTAKPEDTVQEVQNLIWNLPPGTAKSRMISVAFLAWCWLHKPNFSLNFYSGTPKVVTRDSEKFSQLIRSDWYARFEVPWTIIKDSVGKVENSMHGFRGASGLRASVTGDRADGFVIDDADDAELVHSPAYREEGHKRYRALENRINSDRRGLRLVMAQRVHDDDTTGYLLRTERHKWHHICIPLEHGKGPVLEPEDKIEGLTQYGTVTWLGRKDPRTKMGETLHADRYPPSKVKAIMANAEIDGEGQYNQNPTAAGATLISMEELARYEAPLMPKEYDQIWMSLDATFKPSTNGKDASPTKSMVGLGVIAQKGAIFDVLEAQSMDLDFEETMRAAQSMRDRWEMQGYRINGMLVEDKANGSAVLQVMHRTFPGLVEIKPEGGKMARAQSCLPVFRAMQLRLPIAAPWLLECEKEITKFPRYRRDDMFDMITQALNYMREDDWLEKFRRRAGVA